MKMKMKRILSAGIDTLQALIVLSLLAIIVSCCVPEGETSLQKLTVTTDTPTGITHTQATLGGKVTDDGGETVTDRGVCVSLSANPTINDPLNAEVLHIGTGKGAFTDTFEGFPASTTVHVRAYATNSKGTEYGEDKVFTTSANTTGLTVTTHTPTDITDTQALLGGDVTTNGAAPTSRGICISLTINPSIDDVDDAYLEIGSGVGSFSSTVIELPPGTAIHVRAYASNATETIYGQDKVFTTLPQAGCPVVNVTSNITTPTTWTTGNVYMVSGIIAVSSVLTIEAGTVIKLNGASIDINSGGKIVANGTTDKRIVFTSFADDSYCGDSNKDGNATTAGKGDWQMLFLNGGSGNSFKNCDFLYGGKNRAGRNCVVEVSVAGPSFTFDHCTFAHTLSSSSATAYAIYAQSYMNDAAVSVFTNNAFYDNDRPIFLDVNYSLDPNNIFHDPKNATTTNKRNGVYLMGGTISGHATNWNVSEVPYVLTTSCRAFTGATLAIGPNAIVKFVATDGELTSTNTVSLHATAFLTSYKDDAHGGDTNGDANASSPTTGDWYGYGNTATGFTVYIAGPNILYASH